LGSWINSHNEELHKFYSSPDIRVIKARRMRCLRYAAHMDEMRHAHKVLVGKFEGKRPLGRCGHRQEDNIGMNLAEIGLDSSDSGQGLVAGCYEDVRLRVFMAVKIQVVVFWIVTSYSDVGYQCFGRPYGLHLQGSICVLPLTTWCHNPKDCSLNLVNMIMNFWVP
jgi:hypothetical protein